MGDLIQLRPRALPPRPESALLLCDRALAEVEETISRAHGWLPRLKGWVREQAVIEIARLEAKREWLAHERLRLAGPELALIRGGLK